MLFRLECIKGELAFIKQHSYNTAVPSLPENKKIQLLQQAIQNRSKELQNTPTAVNARLILVAEYEKLALEQRF